MVEKQKSSDTIRVVVQPRLKKEVRERAYSMGVNMSTYVKHLILNDIHQMPVYRASKRVEKATKEALRGGGIKSDGRKVSEVLGEIMDGTD